MCHVLLTEYIIISKELHIRGKKKKRELQLEVMPSFFGPVIYFFMFI